MAEELEEKETVICVIVGGIFFTSRRLSRLSCINEYLAIDSGGNVIE